MVHPYTWTPVSGGKQEIRWNLRFSFSYRDIEALLAERSIDVDHVTIYQWAQRFTALLADAARP